MLIASALYRSRLIVPYAHRIPSLFLFLLVGMAFVLYEELHDPKTSEAYPLMLRLALFSSLFLQYFILSFYDLQPLFHQPGGFGVGP